MLAEWLLLAESVLNRPSLSAAFWLGPWGKVLRLGPLERGRGRRTKGKSESAHEITELQMRHSAKQSTRTIWAKSGNETSDWCRSITEAITWIATDLKLHVAAAAAAAAPHPVYVICSAMRHARASKARHGSANHCSSFRIPCGSSTVVNGRE